MDSPFNHPELTSEALFHARLEGRTVAPGEQRRATPSVGDLSPAPAEIVTWREGLFTVRGILVDPGLGDVPIEAEGWCHWWTRWTLRSKQHEADKFGSSTAHEIWSERPTCSLVNDPDDDL